MKINVSYSMDSGSATISAPVMATSLMIREPRRLQPTVSTVSYIAEPQQPPIALKFL